MTLVRIVRRWDSPDIMQQTARGEGIWDGVKFTLEPIQPFDYLIILNDPPTRLEVRCSPEKVWTLAQEPPTSFFRFWHINPSHSFKILTSDAKRSGSQYVHSHPAMPWHINKDYDFLLACDIPQKTRQLSWITSNTRLIAGHRTRMTFLQKIEGEITFDLFGRGFKPIEDKWDGLAPYRYSLAIENFSNAYYWTEKIADCFLAWTMPIYYGCSKITDYFPSEAMIQIDITASDVVDQIKSVLAEDPWPRRLEAIAYARELVLKRYQLFPFLVDQIRHFESTSGYPSSPQLITLSPRPLFYEYQSFKQILKKSPDDLVKALIDISLNPQIVMEEVKNWWLKDFRF